jgi:AraC-like DNA-binding protein
LSNEIINPEILDELNELKITENEYQEQNIFKSLDILSKQDDEIIEKLLFEGVIPDKEFVQRVKLSSLGVSLSLIQLAKKLSAKLQIIESYLSKLEDKLFNEETLNTLETGELLQLYQSTRILFERTQDMLMKIQEKIDIDNVTMTLKALYAKDNEEETQLDLENNEDIDEIMEYIKEIRLKKAKEKLEEETKI